MSTLLSCDLFRLARFIGLFDPHGCRWIRHQDFSLAASSISLAQPLGHDANVGNAGSEYAVEVLGFVDGKMTHRTPLDRETIILRKIFEPTKQVRDLVGLTFRGLLVLLVRTSKHLGAAPEKYQWGEILEILPPDPKTSEEAIRRNIQV